MKKLLQSLCYLCWIPLLLALPTIDRLYKFSTRWDKCPSKLLLCIYLILLLLISIKIYRKLCDIYCEWHIIVSLLLLYIAYLFLVVYCRNDSSTIGNISLSISGGLISGFLIMLVSGTKALQQRKVQAESDKLTMELSLDTPYSKAYHRLYYGKKEAFIKMHSPEYADILIEALQETKKLIENIDKATYTTACLEFKIPVDYEEFQHCCDKQIAQLNGDKYNYEFFTYIYQSLYANEQIIFRCNSIRKYEKITRIKNSLNNSILG